MAHTYDHFMEARTPTAIRGQQSQTMNEHAMLLTFLVIAAVIQQTRQQRGRIPRWVNPDPHPDAKPCRARRDIMPPHLSHLCARNGPLIPPNSTEEPWRWWHTLALAWHVFIRISDTSEPRYLIWLAGPWLFRPHLNHRVTQQPSCSRHPSCHSQSKHLLPPERAALGQSRLATGGLAKDLRAAGADDDSLCV